MKKIFSFLAITGLIFLSNCSKIPENNDPVIGIWSKTEIQAATATLKSSNLRQEWIFNDVYLGRYHYYDNNVTVTVTDFNWEEEDGVYTISYPGIEDKTNDIVTMITSEDGTVLKVVGGNTLATRE